MKISKSTVEKHLAQARKIIGVTTSQEAARLFDAFECGLLPTPSSHPPDLAAKVGRPESGGTGRAAPWSALLPFRERGKTDNDLSIRHRLGWILILAIAFAVSLGSLANFLHLVSDLVHRR